MKESIRYYCTTPTYKLFEDIAKRFNLSEVGSYLHIDRGSRILGVAHMDTVLDSCGRNGVYDHFECKYVPKTNEFVVTSIALDDRLGVYTLLETLPDLGIGFDILLTDNEEVGASTAAQFKTKKKYNWIFSFDRRGLEPVLYQFGGVEWKAALQSCGYNPAFGSFSDICELDSLGVKAANFGVAYNFEHTQSCQVVWSEYQSCITRFKKFYRKYRRIRFPHVYTPPARYYGYRGAYSSEWDDAQYDWRTRGYSQIVTCMPSTTAAGSASTIRLPSTSYCRVCHEYLYAHEKSAGICDDCGKL